MSTSTRGRGGKFSKPKRGGGKHFSRDLQPVNADGELISMWADKEPVDEEDEDDDEDDSEEDSDEEGGQQESQTREQRKALAKARKEAAIAKQKAAAKAAAPGDLPPSDSDEDDDDDDDEDDEDMPANPNHTSKARQQLAPPGDASSPKKPAAELSRREREALQAQQAKERYQKLHAEGKTDEARADLERLRLVREQREAAAARKKAEQEERAEAEKAKKEQLDKERAKREAAMGAGASKRGGRGGKKK